MTIQVIEGQKSEILEKIAQVNGRVSRAILWIEDGAPHSENPFPLPSSDKVHYVARGCYILTLAAF